MLTNPTLGVSTDTHSQLRRNETQTKRLYNDNCDEGREEEKEEKKKKKKQLGSLPKNEFNFVARVQLVSHAT